MSNYSEFIFLLAAVVIYGILVSNTDRSLAANDKLLSTSEIEYGAISAAQDILEKARWMKYTEITESNLQNISQKELYDDNISINTLNQSDCPSSFPCKKIDVKIQSDYLKNADGSNRSITMSLIKTKY